MSTKTITLSLDAYESLKALKGEHESFSDVVRRITVKKSLLEFAGILSSDNANKVRRSIEAGRERSRARAELLKERFHDLR